MRDSHEEYESSLLNQLVDLAQNMLDGKISYLEGAASIMVLRGSISQLSSNDPDILPFVAIASETDHLPLAKERSLWAPDALARVEEEIVRSEEWAKGFAPQACKNIISRFKVE